MSERPTWPKPWPPELIGTYRPDRALNLSRLSPAEKRDKWAEIQREQPELAALLKSKNVQTLIKAFNAEVLVQPEE